VTTVFRYSPGSRCPLYSLQRLDKMARVYLLFIIYFLIPNITSRRSGFYLDNGLDQTVLQKFLSKEAKREVEQEILNLLGLPSRPKPMMPSHLGKSAPKFLLDVYQSLEHEENSLTRSEFSVSGDDQRAIDESDVIMSFNSQSKFTLTTCIYFIIASTTHPNLTPKL